MNSVLSVGMPSRMTSLEKFVEASLVQRSSLRDVLGTCARTVMAAHGSEKLESTSGSWGSVAVIPCSSGGQGHVRLDRSPAAESPERPRKSADGCVQRGPVSVEFNMQNHTSCC